MNEINEKFTQDLIEIINETAAGHNLDGNLKAIDKCIQVTRELKSKQEDNEALETILQIESTLFSVRRKISEAISSLVN